MGARIDASGIRLAVPCTDFNMSSQFRMRLASNMAFSPLHQSCSIRSGSSNVILEQESIARLCPPLPLALFLDSDTWPPKRRFSPTTTLVETVQWRKPSIWVWTDGFERARLAGTSFRPIHRTYEQRCVSLIALSCLSIREDSPLGCSGTAKCDIFIYHVAALPGR